MKGFLADENTKASCLKEPGVGHDKSDRNDLRKGLLNNGKNPARDSVVLTNRCDDLNISKNYRYLQFELEIYK